MHRLPVADVELVGADLPVGAGLHLLGGLDQADLVPVGECEQGALAGGPDREGAADAGAGAGDHDDLAVERPHAETFLSVRERRCVPP